MAPGALIGPGFHEWDFSVSKKWTIHERFGLQASLSAFNFLNVRSYAPIMSMNTPVNSPARFGLSGGQPNDSNPVNGTGGARQLLLGLKMSF
jgi:hypothetical protein